MHYFLSGSTFSSYIQMHKLSVSYRIYPNPMFCIVQCIVAVFFLTIWNCKKFFVWEWLSLEGIGWRRLARIQRKRHGWTALFSHLPESSLMPYHLCNCLHQTTRKFFFSVKHLWRPDSLSSVFYAWTKILRRSLTTNSQILATDTRTANFTHSRY